MSERIKDAISNRARNEWAVAKKAPFAMLAFALAGAAAGYHFASARYDLAMKNLNLTISAKNAQLAAARQTAQSIRRDVVQAKQTTEALYQLHEKVGAVDAVKIDDERGTIYFPSVFDASRLNPVLDFEFRDYVLHLSSAEAVSEAPISEKREKTLLSVKCLIVGRLLRDARSMRQSR